MFKRNMNIHVAINSGIFFFDKLNLQDLETATETAAVNKRYHTSKSLQDIYICEFHNASS
jgi:hypothetical protein